MTSENKFKELPHDIRNELLTACEKGDYVYIKSCILKYGLFGNCGSCFYTADRAYQLMKIAIDQKWI